MADISLGTLRDYWKAVSDWVQGNSADKPEIAGYDSTDDAMKTKQIGSIVLDNFESRNGNLAYGTSEVVFESKKELIINGFTAYFEVDGDLRFRFYVYDSNTNSFSAYRALAGPGTITGLINPSVAQYNGLFTTLVNDTNDRVVIMRDMPKRFRGVRVEVENLSSDTDYNIGIGVEYSEV